MARTEWLSEGAERLAAELIAGPGPHCDVAIVGSGYGGAVAAARLAGATESDGRRSRVWLLERGREYLSGSFPERFADLPGHVRITAGEQPDARGLQEGLFDVRLGEHVSALLGNGLGGGSLINAGVLARPLGSVFRQRPWPWQFADDALEPHFRTVEAMLAQSRIPTRPPKLERLEWLGRGIDGTDADRRANVAVNFNGGSGPNRFGVPQANCVGCGDCFTGCNHGAKNTLATNYLPLAFRRGARLFTGVTVLSLGRAGRHWALQLQFTDSQIQRRFGAEFPTLFARRVILAAGSYGSTGILLRSREKGFRQLATQRLGRRFSTNGDMIAVAAGMSAPVRASARESQAPGERGIGPTICGLVDRRWARVPLAIEELAIPAALRRPFEEIVTTLSTVYGLTRVDWSRHGTRNSADPAAFQDDAIDRTAVYATMGDDGAAGEIALMRHDGALMSDAGVQVAWPRVADLPVFREAMATLERAHGPFGATVMPNPMWRALPESLNGVLEGGPLGGGVFTVHPLGGCAMAERAEEGVVNRLGQVFSADHGDDVHDSLAVLDGAIVPTALGINPCLTIAALAEYAVEGLAGCWGMDLMRGAELRRDLPSPPALRAPAAAHRAPRPTAIRLAERLGCRSMQLPVRLAAGNVHWTAFDAELEIEYEPVGDLEQFLGLLPKTLLLHEARLKLEGTLPAGAALGGGVHWSETLLLRGELRPFEREPSAVWTRIGRAGSAWWKNRGRYELPRMISRWLRGESRPGGTGLLGMLTGWLAIASRAGEVRRMVYELSVVSGRLLAPGALLSGEKRIAYSAAQQNQADPWSSPWDQLTKLPVSLRTPEVAARRVGVFEVDLPYFVQQHAAQLQVVAQEDQPRALADLYSLFAYLVRLVGGIHFWSFRAPDYPDPYPLYEFGEAFNAEQSRAAHEAARAAGVRTEDRLSHRRPGELPGLTRTFLEVTLPRPEGEQAPQGPVPAQQELEPQIRLTRYESQSVEKNPAYPPVLLIHGLGAGGNTFTLPTVHENLVQHLAARGFDPWVLDLRTSIGLPSSKRDWSFDDAAFGDIPSAIELVLHETRKTQLDVVAHCIGSAMFCMAALGGALKGNPVRAAVLSQVGPLLELPAINRFRGYLASHFKHYLRIDEFDTTGSLTPFNRFLDRVLATYPYPQAERLVHQPAHWSRPVRHEAFCLRTFGIYGRLFEHENLDERTLERLGDYLGHIRYRTYQQTIFYATMRRLTDRLGRNQFVTHDNIKAHFDFPVCFIHGVENEVFHRNTSRRSFDLLASVFWTRELARIWEHHPERRYQYAAYTTGRRLRIHEIPGHGHQDCIIGRHASAEVYPKIADFLLEAKDEASIAPSVFVVRPPRIGPVLGWLRPGADGVIVARILFTPNDSRSKPLYAMTIVLPRDGRQGAQARFHRLLGAENPSSPTEALDVCLPGDGAAYDVVILTIHREQYEPEPGREAGEPRGDDPFGENLDRFPLLPDGLLFPPSGEAAERLSAAEVDPFVEPVLATSRDLDLDRAPLPTQPRTCDPRYATPVSVAVLSEPVMAGARPAAGSAVCFALASCRYGATAVDRELADASLGRLRRRLTSGEDRCVPQALFLAGDAIYADATYGIFDPTLGLERYDQRYFEAWSAPNAREVLRRVPVYPMLDDHEVEENFEGRPQRPSEQMIAGLRAFEYFQLRLTPAFPDPRTLSPRIDRYWYRATVGGMEFFVADTRTQRRRPAGPDGARASIMRRTQMRALTAWLEDAQARHGSMPKFVVSPSVVAPWMLETRGDLSYSLRSDAWDAFPESLHQLLGFIAANGIRNVVFLSGDYHCSVYATMTLSCAGRPPMTAYSIVSSGLYSPYPFANARAEDLELRFNGTHRAWLGGGRPPCCERWGDLAIDYRAQLMCSDASYAVVGVERRGDGSVWMSVDFDQCDRPVEEQLA